jgi:hypothetical protein
VDDYRFLPLHCTLKLYFGFFFCFANISFDISKLRKYFVANFTKKTREYTVDQPNSETFITLPNLQNKPSQSSYDQSINNIKLCGV